MAPKTGLAALTRFRVKVSAESATDSGKDSRMATAAELAILVGGELRGNGELVLLGAQALDKAGPQEITFASDEKHIRKLDASVAGAVLVPRQLVSAIPRNARPETFILVEDPRAAFLQVLTAMRPQRAHRPSSVTAGAVISATAKIGTNTAIHPGAFIGDDVVIGDECEIHPGVCIGPGCTIGNHTTLYPNAVLYHDVHVGNRVIIHAGAVIGADGFGYRLEDGRHRKIPHFGTVRICDDVEIGACTTVDRAMIGETVIGEGTKLDNHVMIAHNCEIGRHNVFVSQVGLAGSVTTGDYVVCAGQVGIADHVHLGDGCRLGAKTGVHKSLEGGQTYIGAPAAPEAEARRILMAQQRLPELRKQVKDLERQMADLHARIKALEPPSRGELRAAA